MPLKTFLHRMRGPGECAARHSLAWMIWSWIGAFAGILLVGLINRLWPVSATDHIFLIGSFGASAVLIYGTPHVPYAQPRNLVGGHLVSAFIGVAVMQLLPGAMMELQAALAVATAIFAMHLTRTLHPPGGASALIAVIGSDQVHALGFEYVLRPVLAGALLLLLVALIVNNLRDDEERHYPKCWW